MKRKRGRQYCAGCDRWVGTWEGTRRRATFEKRPNFGRFCQRGHELILLCVDCWPDHELEHVAA